MRLCPLCQKQNVVQSKSRVPDRAGIRRRGPPNLALPIAYPPTKVHIVSYAQTTRIYVYNAVVVQALLLDESNVRPDSRRVVQQTGNETTEWPPRASLLDDEDVLHE